MTKPAFRRVAVFVGTAALAAGSGVGVAAQGDEANRSGTPSVASRQAATSDTAATPAPEAPAEKA
jgi:hypothetical protein